MNKEINNFYSRQIGTYGLGTMNKIMKMNIFIYGMRGVGIETAKNIVLAGPKSLTIFDPFKVKMNDLTSNYFLKEEHVQKGQKRDESCISDLINLNSYVKLNIMEGDDIVSDIQKKNNDPEIKYDVVVITEFLSKSKIIEIDEICRKNNIGFILSLEFGIYSYIFVDFGNEFKIYDNTGEEIKEYLIESITKEKNGKVFINNQLSGKLNLTSNDFVSFKEIEGMTELNNCQPIKIKINGDSIEIGDTSNFSDYISGGIIFNVKIPKLLNFESFKERVEIPLKEGEEYNDPLDFLNLNIQEILHIGLLSLFDFYDKNNILPEINLQNDAEELLLLSKNILKLKQNENVYWVKNIRENLEDYDIDFDLIFEKTMKYLSNWAKVEICPISSFIGGVTAQEIIKFSGKYEPIHQWLYCDFSQIVENLNLTDIDRKLNNSRYDDQIAIFGNDIQKKLANSNIFMVGAGALGCEYLKTFSMMGIAVESDKKVYVTDNDNIEISNLNRQFLFNKSTIGKSKSEVACTTIKNMNKDFNCVAFKTRVSEENEYFFNEDFWNKQDYIINAVDNIKARIYIAEQSLIYKKILIDSGTLGTKANSQIMIPHKTIPYSPPEEKEDKIPMCTLADHPFNIIHCIEWAKDNFDGYFVNILKEVKMFLEDRENFYKYIKKEYVLSEQIEKLSKVFEYSKIAIEKNFEKCVEIGLKQYNVNFNNKILDLISQHDKDSLNEEGTKYWTGDKRFPHPLPFNAENENALLFVKKYAQILARNLNIPIIDDDKEIIKIISKIKIEEYIPNSFNNKKNYSYYNKNKLSKEEKKAKIKLMTEKVNNYINEINKYFDSIEKKKYDDLINIEGFEKDDDEKGHVEFLYAFSNLRAENYNIEKCEISKVKLIAGKIVPAIASTTAAIVGIVALQLYVLKQTEDINFLRNCYFNFARNVICFENLRRNKNVKDGNDNLKDSEKKFKLVPEKYSIWDYLIINKSMTIKEIILYIKKEYNVDITSITSNQINLYLKNISSNNIFEKKIEDIYNSLSNNKLFDNKKYLMLEIGGDIDEFYAKMPLFKYNFK